MKYIVINYFHCFLDKKQKQMNFQVKNTTFEEGDNDISSFSVKFTVHIIKDENEIGTCDISIGNSSQDVKWSDEEGNCFHFKPKRISPTIKTEEIDYFEFQEHTVPGEFNAYIDKPLSSNCDSNQKQSRRRSNRKRKEKLFQCRVCGESFATSKLLEHQKAHKGLQQFTRKECGKKFTQGEMLKLDQTAHKVQSCKIGGKSIQKQITKKKFNTVKSFKC